MHGAGNDTVGFELAQLERECLRRDPRQGRLQFGETPRMRLEFEQDRRLPSTTNDIERRPHRAIVAQSIEFWRVIGERFHGHNLGESSLETRLGPNQGSMRLLFRLMGRFQIDGGPLS
jgi:hypothetical protein